MENIAGVLNNEQQEMDRLWFHY